MRRRDTCDSKTMRGETEGEGGRERETEIRRALSKMDENETERKTGDSSRMRGER